MSILNQKVSVINLGLEGFAQDLKEQSVPTVQVDWKPPAGGDAELISALAKLRGSEIEEANQQTVQRMLDSRPLWIDVDSAINAIPNMQPNQILHSGPPIDFDEMCDPQQWAIEGAAVFEGWVENREQLRNKVKNGDIVLTPNYMMGSIGPMCGPISPSMSVIVTEDANTQKRSWSPFNEGKGNVLWMGTYDAGTIERLNWFRDHFGPGLKKALEQSENGIDIFQIIAEGIQMGDELHARSGACTSLLIRKLVPLLLKTDLEKSEIQDIVEMINSNNHFFLNLTLTACKVAAEAAHGVKNSTVVTAMSRNGVDFALRVGGMDEWFIAKTAPMDEAIYYAGYSVDDAAGDIGDSAIVETLGLGGMVIGAAPTVSSFVGGSMHDLWEAMRKMQAICVSNNPRFAPASADFMPPALGIDIRKVVQTGVTPIIDTGVIHKSSGVGQIGAGVARAPMEVFAKAVKQGGINHV